MKNKLLIIVVLILSVILLFQKRQILKKNVDSKEKLKTIDVKNSQTGEIEHQELEDYILGVVAAEMPASFLDEALKAQAIASRTYAYYKMQNSNNDYDVISDISDQAYITIDQMKEKWQNDFETYYNKIKNIVNETKNEIMTYQGNTIESFYFAMSNGYTEDVSSVFKENLPYLISVESRWDNESLKNYEVSTNFSKEEFCQKLNIFCKDIIINSQNFDNTGRTKEITINSTTFSGVEFRKLLNLRSTDFKILVNDNNVNITTKGYGHGVGMSQYGANGMAKEGYNCYEILKYYYNGIEIQKI